MTEGTTAGTDYMLGTTAATAEKGTADTEGQLGRLGAQALYQDAG